MSLARIAAFLAVILFMAGSVPGQDVQVSASVGSDTVGVQDQFQLTVTVSGKDSGDAETPRLSRLQDFKIVAGPNISTQFQWINGRTSSSRSFTYILLPEREGQFTIDAVEVRVGNKIYKTQPLQVRVTSAPRNPPLQRQSRPNPLDLFDEGNPPESKSSGDAVIVVAELDRSSVYPGQQVTLTYQVYTQVGITGIQLQESPPLTGFWVEDIEVAKNLAGTRKILNGKEYLVYTIKKQALFATTTGKLQIPSSTFAISAGAGDFWGLFSRAETLYRKSRELFLDVKPLPAAGRPADFSNAVGTYNLTANIDKTQVAAGDAVALRVRLEGRGNLKMIPDISVPSIPDFTIYSSKRSENIRSFEEAQIGGDKTWEYVIVPKAPGQQTIPSLSFSYFDPGRDRFETVTTPALGLNVMRGADNAVSVSGLSETNKQNLTRRGTDINFIKLSAGGLDKQAKPFYSSLWFYLIAAIPLAFNAGAVFYRIQRYRLSEDTAFVRSRRAKHNAVKNLKRAERAGKSEARRFYDQAAAALSGYLSDRFNLSEIELTGDNLKRTLAAKAVPFQIVEETTACLSECDFGRFVSASGSPDKMRELRGRIRNNIEALERTADQEMKNKNR